MPAGYTSSLISLECLYGKQFPHWLIHTSLPSLVFTVCVLLLIPHTSCLWFITLSLPLTSIARSIFPSNSWSICPVGLGRVPASGMGFPF